MAQMGVGWLWQMKQGMDSATNWKVQVGDEESPLEAATAQERSVERGISRFGGFLGVGG